MSPTRINATDLMAPRDVLRKIGRRSLIIGLIFAAASLLGYFVDVKEFFPAYLLAYTAWLGVTLGCMAFLMIQHLTGGNWAIVIRRMLEAGTRTLWLMIPLFIPIVLGMKHLYVWKDPAELAHNHHLQELAESYLTTGGFIWRAIVYFVIWAIWAYFLTRWGGELDNPPDRDISEKFRTLAAPGLVVYAFSMSFASIDWVMSLDARWISTIYGMIFLVEQCLAALCLIVIVEGILSRYKPLSEILKPKDVQDHGKLILTFIMLYAYFSFSQFLIIWAGNLPDEISWYLRRIYNGWEGVALVLVAGHFAVPFLFLLSRPFKRHMNTMIWLSAGVLVMVLLNLFWFVEPHFHKNVSGSWLDVVVPVAIGGFWLAAFFRYLGQRPLLPVHDTHIEAVLEPTHER